jgi:hypothetical protein
LAQIPCACDLALGLDRISLVGVGERGVLLYILHRRPHRTRKRCHEYL